MPAKPQACYVFAHGAGAGMTHPFMEHVAQGLAERGIATLRYQFAYMENGSKRPDPMPVLQQCIRDAVAHARTTLRPRRLLIGGRSMGNNRAPTNA